MVEVWREESRQSLPEGCFCWRLLLFLFLPEVGVLSFCRAAKFIEILNNVEGEGVGLLLLQKDEFQAESEEE